MKIIINNNANITMKKIKESLMHKEKIVLTIDIEYPSISLPKGTAAEKRINLSFESIANKFYNYAIDVILPNAIEVYEANIKEGYPFNPYEAYMRYTITLNNNCTLSTYYDQYEYTGGAHGNTLRASNTYSLQTGNILKLKDFFENTKNYKIMIIHQIQIQARQNMLKNPGIYFNDYKKLIIQYFNEDSFYITPDSINIYYQQYEIAPYSTGIVVFAIAYKELVIKKPHCTRNIL